MALKIFPKPQEQIPVINKKFVAQSAAVSVIKSTAANIFIPDTVTDEPIGTSYLGTPIIDNLEFAAGAYTDLQDNTIDYGAVVLDTVVIEVNRPKNIVYTSIQGRDNEVLEYVGMKNYVINVRGKISNKENYYPLNEARALRALFEVPQQLPVVSLFLNDVHEIFNIVIKSFSMPQVEGKQNEQDFTFVASSDVPIDLEELE